MMAFFSAKKFRPVAAFILILALVITYAVPMTSYAAPSTPTTKNFMVNLFDYDHQMMNDKVQTTYPSAAKNTLFVFSDKGTYKGISSGNVGDHSKWTGETSNGSGVSKGVYAGIVGSSLANGMPAYSSSIKGLDLFKLNSNDYLSYANVAFPFTYNETTKMYSYDSSSQSAEFKKTANKIELGTQTGSGEARGFWPFKQTASPGYDIHFGMSMEVEFYIPTNKKIDGNHMVFNFSGDDDVWIYVDDKLVLDLGGVHLPCGGSIDFTTGQIGRPTVANGKTLPDELQDIFSDYSSRFADNSTHILKIFYLERGGGQSNLKMNFNIPSVEPVTVEKALNNDGEFTTDAAFDFVIETGHNENQLSAFANKPYDVVQSTNGDFLRSATTDSNGGFTLKSGEKAVFSEIADKDWYLITEDITEGLYNCEWTAPSGSGQPAQSPGPNAVKGKFQYGASEGDYALLCTNTMVTTDVIFDKLDALLETPVSGAAFKLEAVSGVQGFDFASSGSDGQVIFTGVPKGEYLLTEELAAPGYLTSDKEFKVIVDYAAQPQVFRVSTATLQEDELVVQILDESGEEGPVLVDTIYNDPRLMDLTVTKKVQGSHALENTSDETVLYSMVIEFGDNFSLADTENITSVGAVGLDSIGDGAYSFMLPSGGSITFPIKEGVGYTVYEENSDDYTQYFTMSGDAAEYLQGDGARGITAVMSTTSALTVLNQYGNDGLTVLKLVSGNQAPDTEEDIFDFTAKFWAPESQDNMETALMNEVEEKLSDASNAAATAEALMTEDDWAALDDAEQAVTDAAVTLAAVTAELETAQEEFDLAEEALEAANTSATALQLQIDALDEITDAETIADLVDEIAALNISDLEEALETAEAALSDAQDAYDDAVTDKEAADAALEALKTAPGVIKDYLDAQEALAEAQAEFDDAQDNTEDNIFKRIWERVVDFFLDLVVGETYGEGVDIVYSGTASDFDYDDTTSECAFSLGISDSITFNFDQYFEENPGVDKVFFEINETNKGGANDVDIDTDGDSFPEIPEIAENGKTIKGYIDRETMDPTIVYTNEYDNIIERSYIVYHKTEDGTVISSDSAIGIVGEELDLSQGDFDGYSYKSVSAVGMTINPDEDGNIKDIFPDESAVVITYVYEEDEEPVTPDEPRRRNRTTTIVDDAVPAAPVTPEAIDNAEQIIQNDAVPAGPLPKTGGVPSLLLYGLGALLAGGGAALKLRNKKDEEK